MDNTSLDSKEGPPEELQVTPDGQLVSTQALLPKQVPYNNGFGDFCFGRRARLRSWSCDLNTGPHSCNYKGWEIGSYGVKVLEIGGFQRYDSYQELRALFNNSTDLDHFLS